MKHAIILSAIGILVCPGTFYDVLLFISLVLLILKLSYHEDYLISDILYFIFSGYNPLYILSGFYNAHQIKNIFVLF